MATAGDIIAMKLDVIARGGRQKDFWDIHELLDYFSLGEMLMFYKKRYPYNYTEQEILDKLIDFSTADNDFKPECLRGKHWEIIKLDIIEAIEKNATSSPS